MSDNLLYALLTICLSLLIVLLYFCVKFMVMKEDIEYLEILRGEMYKYLTEHNKLHTLHLIEGEHEKRIEKGNMYK